MTAPVFVHLKEKVSFDPSRFAPKPLFECPEMKVIQAAFRAGQFIPVHKPDVHVVLYIVSGEGEIVAGGKSRHVREGDLVVVPRTGARGVRGKTGMGIAHLVSPPPRTTERTARSPHPPDRGRYWGGWGGGGGGGLVCYF